MLMRRGTALNVAQRIHQAAALFALPGSPVRFHPCVASSASDARNPAVDARS